jgi:hypothetical protein
MKNNTLSIYLFLILLLESFPAKAQNSDLLFRYYSGSYNSMGETGIAASQNIPSFDLNPAALVNSNSINVSLSQKIKFYSYDLDRISSTVGGTTFVWDKTQWLFEYGALTFPVTENLIIGAGVFQKLNPQLINKKRAVTFSDLFTQETSGSVYAAAGTICYSFSNSFSAGLNVYKYFGTITSNVVGDNHGNDADKWAKLESNLNGINLKLGFLFKQENWAAGVTLESPFKMKVDAAKQISANRLYEYLFPDYESADLNMPFVIGAGFSYKESANWLFEADYESRQYKSSEVQFNLYEFGGQPAWNSINILRVGAQYITNGDYQIPFRAGYEYVPQLYYSGNSTGQSNSVSSYVNTDRNIKHILTLGTSLNIKNLVIDLAFEYSILKWRQVLIVPQTINDDYTETNYSFSLGIVYKI